MDYDLNCEFVVVSNGKLRLFADYLQFYEFAQSVFLARSKDAYPTLDTISPDDLYSAVADLKSALKE